MNKRSMLIDLYMSFVIAFMLRPLVKDNLNYMFSCMFAGMVYSVLKGALK